MNFREWVADFGGAQRVATSLKIKRRTVDFWLQGVTSPTAKRMIQLIMLSQGRLSFDDVYAVRAVKKARRK